MKKPVQTERKLGRGLSALLGENKMLKQPKLNQGHSSGQNLKAVELINLNQITAGIYQPRVIFDQEKLLELAESIKENGLIQPIILRKINDENNYEIIAGERRYRAASMAKLESIPAIIKKINNHEALEMAIVENTQRSDLSPIEEASGYQRLINDFSYSQEKIAKRVGKSRSYIANLLRLLTLPEPIQDLLNKESITAGHARAIINSNNPEALAESIITNKLSVRETEHIARQQKKSGINNFKNNTINNTHISILESDLCDLTNMKVKISYSSLTDSGKISINFNNIEEVQTLIKKL